MSLINRITQELKDNNNKLSNSFIDKELFNSSTRIEHGKIGDSCRVCVITLPAGHKLVGYALVLDPKNDIESVGQEVAYTNAADKIWETYGSIAKAIME